QWQYNDNGTWTDIVGATNPVYAASNVAQTTEYRAVVTCTATGDYDNSNVVTAEVLVPGIDNVYPGSRCDAGPVTLVATAADPSATLNWYDVATGGTSIGTGGAFVTPVLTSGTTTYYVAASDGGSTITGAGRVAPASTATGYSSGASPYWGLIFDAYEEFVIESVDVYPSTSGSFTVELATLGGSAIQTAGPFTVTSTGSTIATGATAVTLPL